MTFSSSMTLSTGNKVQRYTQIGTRVELKELNSFQTRPGSRSGFRVLTGSSGSNFFRLKQRHFSKKQKLMGCN
jgi:hypothetical protein